MSGGWLACDAELIANLGNEGFQLGAASFLQTVLESFHFIKVALEEKNNKVALDHYLKKFFFKNI